MANPFDKSYDNPFASTPRDAQPSTSSPYFPGQQSGYQPNFPALGAAAATYAAHSEATRAPRQTEPPSRRQEVLEIAANPTAPRHTEVLKKDSELMPWWGKLAIPICPTKRFRVKVKLHASFLIFWAIMIANGFGHSAERGFVSLICIGPILLVSVLAHELLHMLMARMLKLQVDSIVLSPFGGMTYCAHLPQAKTDILIALAGPMAHVPIGVIFYFLLDASAGNWWHVDESGDGVLQDPNLWSRICYSTLVIQVTLFFMNLLIPCFPLDSGRIVVDLFAVANFDRESAAKVCAALASVEGLGIFVFGVVFSIKNMTLNSCVLIGFWVVWQAWGMFRFVKNGKVEEHPMFANYYGDPNDADRI